ncbi:MULTISPECIES: ankyrin repeat domain-containing protein [unclassified Variovorax]|uniref:ankyrin repeat domain-containing protein n=1 Tax=unclassified Variovorax TaxID=663243 RepID=UPI00076BF214|nr:MULTISPECIES: ankyrin repeat domain-containing protein [unclassified Variovorax]KWT91734.1 hypothetical protein APY03_3171 [Variovorax sp. WDL1]PNG53324.1 hypothetical protein CHC06_04671 [Variovorax sp. B2]PNG53896.1 hypothetical protein CHC07_03718 [Variovorax sp. B4]VTV11361.1 Ribulose-5-phosphate 4-epimerase and aldolases [Variovorax sp. WDL1]
MNFTPWQIDELARGLNTYRALKTVNGRSPPWKTVLDHLLLSPATAHSYLESGEPPTFKEEALRRFAEGGSTLQPDKLEDVRRFLVAQRLLREDEFTGEDDDLRHILSASSFLAARASESLKSLELLSGPYIARPQDSQTAREITLRFSRAPTDWFVRVTEETAPPGNAARSVKGRTRRGYGFVCTPLNLLHIFLVGSTEEVEITYIQLADDYTGPPKLTLARVGEGTEATGVYALDPNPEHELSWPHSVHAFFHEKFPMLARGPQWGPPHRDNWKGPPQRVPIVNALPLIEYAKVGDANSLRAALAAGAAVNAQDDRGMTALHHAAARGERPCIRLLIGTGQCDHLLRDNKGRYAFELAIQWARDYGVARLLMKKQAQQAHAQGVPAYVQRA